MLRQIVNRFSDWYDRRSQDAQAYWLFAFSLAFILLLGVSIRFIPFIAYGGSIEIPQHIGHAAASGHTNLLTPKKH